MILKWSALTLLSVFAIGTSVPVSAASISPYSGQYRGAYRLASPNRECTKAGRMVLTIRRDSSIVGVASSSEGQVTGSGTVSRRGVVRGYFTYPNGRGGFSGVVRGGRISGQARDTYGCAYRFVLSK
jgi:hypothetical protein